MTSTSGLVAMVFVLFMSLTSYGQTNGIMPGEPDPNLSPRKDKDDVDHDAHGTIDDRQNCPKGTKRFQKMTCGDPKKQPECQNYSPVMECHKMPPTMHCKKPAIPVPVYTCTH